MRISCYVDRGVEAQHRGRKIKNLRSTAAKLGFCLLQAAAARSSDSPDGVSEENNTAMAQTLRESFFGRNRTGGPHAKRGALILPEPASQGSMKEGQSREIVRLRNKWLSLRFPPVFIVALSQTILPETVARARKIETSLGRFVCLLAARLLPTRDGDIGTLLVRKTR